MSPSCGGHGGLAEYVAGKAFMIDNGGYICAELAFFAN